MAGPRNSARVAVADLVPCLLWIGMRVRLRDSALTSHRHCAIFSNARALGNGLPVALRALSNLRRPPTFE
jgi:hypothetical protein